MFRSPRRFTLWLCLSHALVGGLGFAAGIYTLPLLIAPPAPSVAELEQAAAVAHYRGQFVRDLKGSDPLHWGEGEVSVGPDRIVLQGRLAPGPDYKLYVSPQFVDTKADFLRVKSQMQLVGDVRTFNGFAVDVPAGVNVSDYHAVVVWCERFSQFITAAQYR